MKVRQIMSSPAITAPTDATVAQVARIMLDGGLTGIPIVNSDGSLVGIVTERDLVTKHAHPHVPIYLGILGGILPFETRDRDEEVRRVLAVNAGDLMSDARAISPDEDVETAADVMVDTGANPLVVVENGTIVGVVSESDIVRLVLSDEEDDSAPI